MTDETEAPGRSFFWFVVAVAILLALLNRFPLLGDSGFPLGEGGLFVLFSEAILDNGFALPGQVTYGGVTIPFAYPPAGFYLAAAVARASSSDLLGIFYWLPILLNMLAVPAFCFLAAQVTKDRAAFLCACVLYVQLPDSFVWQITGGGLPRSLGAVLALLAVGLAFRGARAPSRKALLLCGLSTGLAVLSHLEWGMFAAAGVSLAFLSSTIGWKRPVLLTSAAGAIAVIVVAPWIIAILSRHGLDPFLSSSSASNWNPGNFIGSTVTGRIFGLLILPAALGAFVTIARRNWFLVAWALTTMLLTPRMGANVGLAIPASLLAGHGLKAAGQFLSNELGFRTTRWSALRPAKAWAGIELPVFALLILTSLLLATPLRWTYHDPRIVEQLDPASRDALAWIRRHTPQASSFVVISGAPLWFVDSVAEWFPYLAGRESVTTGQGLEWAGKGVFVAKTNEIGAFKAAQQAAPALAAALVREHYCGVDYVALFLPPAAPERQSLLKSADFEAVYANEGASVFRARQGQVCV